MLTRRKKQESGAAASQSLHQELNSRFNRAVHGDAPTSNSASGFGQFCGEICEMALTASQMQQYSESFR